MGSLFKKKMSSITKLLATRGPGYLVAADFLRSWALAKHWENPSGFSEGIMATLPKFDSSPLKNGGKGRRSFPIGALR